MSEFNLRPNEKAEANEFWEAMLTPEAPDEMVFQINKVPSNPSGISQEAVDGIAEQFRLFLMARVYGQSKRDGIPARHLRASVQLNWHPGEPMSDPTVGPYYNVGDDGMTPLDGTRRSHAWRAP